MCCTVKSTEMTRTGFEPSTTRPRTCTVQCGHDRSVVETRQLDLKTALFFFQIRRAASGGTRTLTLQTVQMFYQQRQPSWTGRIFQVYTRAKASLPCFLYIPVHTHMYMYGSEWWVKGIRGRRANKQTCPHGQRWVVGIHSQQTHTMQAHVPSWGPGLCPLI